LTPAVAVARRRATSAAVVLGRLERMAGEHR
jgi:hypothetical protein